MFRNENISQDHDNEEASLAYIQVPIPKTSDNRLSTPITEYVAKVRLAILCIIIKNVYYI